MSKLQVNTELDREDQDSHILLIKATENCESPPLNQSFFDVSDDTQLKVIVTVIDVNDNPPKFSRRVFTGGVSTATSFGTKFMAVKVFITNAIHFMSHSIHGCLFTGD